MDHRVFLITGASSGIGAATARLAADAGYKLVLAARSEDKLQALEQELSTDTVTVPTDVTSFADLERLAATAQDAFGRIDVVFANAGVGFPRGFADTDPTVGTVGRDTSGPTTDDAMTRSEERLNVGTRSEEIGRARLRKYVVTENATETVPVAAS